MQRKIIAILIALLFAFAIANAGDFYSIYHNLGYRWNPDSAADHQDTLLNRKIKVDLFENGYLFIKVTGPSAMSTAFYIIFEAWNGFFKKGPFTDSASTSPEIFFRDSIVGDTVLHYLIHYAADTAIGQWFNWIIYVKDTLNEPDTIISIEEYLQTF